MSIIDDDNYEVFYVNSRKRLNGDDSDFTFSLAIDRNKKYNRIALLDVSIPKSFLLIQDSYNTFTLREGVNDFTITIRAANYNRNSFRSVLQDALNTAGAYTYTITNDNLNTIGDDGKYTYSVSGNSGDQPYFVVGENMYEQLGFDKNTTYQFSANSLKSANVVSFTNETTLFLHCDRCTNKNDDILQNIISVGTSDYSYVTWENKDIEINSKIFTSNDIDNVRFYLTDENNIPIFLGGLNMNFRVCVYRKRENIDKLVKLDLLRKSLK